MNNTASEIMKDIRDIRSGRVTPEELAKGGTKMSAEALTVSEVGEILGISRYAVYRAIKNGSIPVIRLGKKKVLIPVRQITKMLAGEACEK